MIRNNAWAALLGASLAIAGIHWYEAKYWIVFIPTMIGVSMIKRAKEGK